VQKGAKIGIAAVCTVMLVGAGYGAYSIATAVSGSSASDKPKPRTVVAEPPSPELASAGAKAFLDAWSKGDVDGAAKLTDAPDAATAALQAFAAKVKPSAVTLTVGGAATAMPSASASASPSASAKASASASAAASPSASAAPALPGLVPWSFKAKVEFAETSTPWLYDGVLGMVKMSDGTAAVHWAPSDLNPNLHPGESIAIKPIFAPPTGIADRKGRPLDRYPSLTPILAGLKTAAPAGNPADAGSAVVITNDAGGKDSKPLFTVKDPKPTGQLKLTLDADLQAAAENAVADQARNSPTHSASLVAIEPSTGGVLAFANAPTNGLNRAFGGGTAPGSTMKIITAAALLEAGDTPDTAVACPPTTQATGLTVQNDKGEQDPGANLRKDFTISCNTAFINEGTAKLKPGTLTTIAKDVFGLGLVWKTGTSSFDTDIPAATDKATAATEYFGQGKVRTNSLAMASVSATVQSGTFKQPILVPGMDQVQAARPLAPQALAALRSMMFDVTHASDGTAAGIPGMPADAYGKTGTAETAAQKPNSWFTGYRGNLAVAAEVEQGGYGADAAGPAVVQLLKIGNNG
jgi:hypothetical protein